MQMNNVFLGLSVWEINELFSYSKRVRLLVDVEGLVVGLPGVAEGLKKRELFPIKNPI